MTHTIAEYYCTTIAQSMYARPAPRTPACRWPLVRLFWLLELLQVVEPTPRLVPLDLLLELRAPLVFLLSARTLSSWSCLALSLGAPASASG